MDKKEVLKQIELLETVNELFPIKYPEGSFILFDFPEDGKFNCIWYNKIGGKAKNEGNTRNIVRNPPEWQGLSAKEANEIAKRFDSYVLGVYGKSKVEEEFGVNWDKEEEES